MRPSTRDIPARKRERERAGDDNRPDAASLGMATTLKELAYRWKNWTNRCKGMHVKFLMIAM